MKPGGQARILKRLWMELQDAAHITPSAKLAQARQDIEDDPRPYAHGEHRLPVAVTHKLGSTSITATLALHDLLDIVDPDRIHCEDHGEVTMGLEDFLAAVGRGADRQAESEAA